MDLIQEQKKALTAYTKTFGELEELQTEHSAIFTHAEELKNKMGEQESLVKKLSAQTKNEVENRRFKVTVTRSFRKWFSFSEMSKHLDEKQEKLVFQTCVDDIKIDSPDAKKKLQELVDAEKVPVEAIQKAFHEEEMTPRVSIKPLK